LFDWRTKLFNSLSSQKPRPMLAFAPALLAVLELRLVLEVAPMASGTVASDDRARLGASSSSSASS
jgi:hypothetical protein